MHVRTAAVVALASLSFAPGALAATPGPQTLTVDGQGAVMITPDVASLSVSVTRHAATSQPALSATNRTVQAIVAAIRHVGVPSSGIQTQSLNTSCGRVRIGPKGHRQLVRRCTASQSVSITSTAALAGRVVDAANHAGASDVNGPNFSFSDPSAGELAAEKAAIADAQRQANAAAAQLGCVVTGVQSVDLNPSSGITAASGSSGGVARAAKTPAPTRLHPGRQEVDATVAVVFTIGPAGAGS